MLWRGFQKPKRLAVEQDTLTPSFGKFSAQPFERGFGTTIGNALRRTLLSSIEGAAVTADVENAGDGAEHAGLGGLRALLSRRRGDLWLSRRRRDLRRRELRRRNF